MRQSSFPFDGSAEPEDRSLLKVLDESNAGGDKARRRFHELVAKIEARRTELKDWQDYVLRYNQRLTAELEPLHGEIREAQKNMAFLIDELLTRPPAGRPLARKYRHTLRELLDSLLDDALADDDDARLSARRQKQEDPQAEELRRAEMDLTRGLLEILGVEIEDDHGARSPEELMEYAHRRLHEREEEAREAEQRRQARREDRARSRPKSAKAQAAEARREEAARAVSQSLREVFRKLASALHPDREPDPDERRRKNALMQEANRAYEANDLLTLLDLQLRIEQIDTEHLSSLGPDRLGHYNQILREQLAELEAEVAHVTAPFRMLAQRGGRLMPAHVDRQIDAEKALLQQVLRQLRDDMTAFRDPARLRRKLDQCEADDDIFDDPDVLGELAALMQTEQAARPRGRKRARKRKRAGKPLEGG